LVAVEMAAKGQQVVTQLFVPVVEEVQADMLVGHRRLTILGVRDQLDLLYYDTKFQMFQFFLLQDSGQHLLE
jgi:hypothetical protein